MMERVVCFQLARENGLGIMPWVRAIYKEKKDEVHS